MGRYDMKWVEKRKNDDGDDKIITISSDDRLVKKEIGYPQH